MSSYDSSLCFLSYLDGNWLFTLPNQCQGQNCTWNIYGAPYVTNILPPSFNRPFNYQCDNQLHSLGWLNAPDEATLSNNYLCTCGGPISIVKLDFTKDNGYIQQIESRCDRPWTPAFGKRCSVISKSPKLRGNFTTALTDPSQGACVSIAGSGQAYPTFNASVSPTAFTVIDGIGITNVCDGSEYDNGSGPTICTCDGQLPATAFGKRVANRNPCFFSLDASDTTIVHPSKAWIAGPVVGGVALVAFSGLLGFLLGRRRSKQYQQQQRQQVWLTGDDDIPLHDIRPSAAPPERQTTHNSDTHSADSGVGLMITQATPTQEAKTPPEQLTS